MHFYESIVPKDFWNPQYNMILLSAQFTFWISNDQLFSREFRDLEYTNKLRSTNKGNK